MEFDLEFRFEMGIEYGIRIRFEIWNWNSIRKWISHNTPINHTESAIGPKREKMRESLRMPKNAPNEELKLLLDSDLE